MSHHIFLLFATGLPIKAAFKKGHVQPKTYHNAKRPDKSSKYLIRP